MRILVTGAAGMVGRHIAQYLIMLGHEVTGTIRNSKSDGVYKTVICDLSQKIEIDGKYDVIVHTAGALPHRKTTAFQYKKDNIDSMENLLEFALKRHVPKIINLSTIGVYGEFRDEVIDEDSDHINPDEYGQSKSYAEKMLKECDIIESVSLRMPGILGKGARGIWITNVIENMRKGIPISVYSPNFVTTNFVGVWDLAEFVGKLIGMKSWKYDTLVIACSDGDRIQDIIDYTKNVTKSDSEIIEKEAVRNPFMLDASHAISMGYPRSSPIKIISRYMDEYYFK